MPLVTKASETLDHVAASIVAAKPRLPRPYSLSDVASLTRALASHLPVKRAFIFGSYARGDQTETSDIDVALEPLYNGAIGYAEIESFRSAIWNILGLDCDVITGLEGSNASFCASFRQEARLVYDCERTGRIKSGKSSSTL